MKHLAASALAVALIGGSPAASQAAASDINGRWVFQTGKFDTIEFSDGCMMSGEMTIRSTQASSVHACSFKIETVCKQQGREAEYYRVKQSCSATTKGPRIAISSRIEEIEETRMDGRIVRLTGYTADMFDLLLSTNGVEMTGQQFDAVRRVPARFWRDKELVS